MIISVELFPPYSQMVGKKHIQIEINKTNNEKVNIEKLIIELIRQYPNIQRLFPKRLSKDNIYGTCFPVREGKVLYMEDEITEEDNIKIYGSLLGG